MPILDIEEQNGEKTTPDIHYHLFFISYSADRGAPKRSAEVQTGSVSNDPAEKGTAVGRNKRAREEFNTPATPRECFVHGRRAALGLLVAQT